jgi:hypothetical protein
MLSEMLFIAHELKLDISKSFEKMTQRDYKKIKERSKNENN